MGIDGAIAELRRQYEAALKLDYVYNPVAWALYQTWKKADNAADRG